MIGTWAALAGTIGLFTPVIVYIDWRKKGRILTHQQYWRQWIYAQGALLVSLVLYELDRQPGWRGLLTLMAACLLGATATFWYAWVVEHCLRIVGAIELSAPSTTHAPDP